MTPTDTHLTILDPDTPKDISGKRSIVVRHDTNLK